MAVMKQRKKLKLTQKDVDNLLIWIIGGMLLGARLLHFLADRRADLLFRPWELLMIWQGGMSFFGGFVGGILGAYIYKRFWKRSFEFLTSLDVVIVPTTLALGLGRIANFINGEIPGTLSNLPWCVVFPNFGHDCRHPYQLYAALSHLLLFVVLLFVQRRKFKKGVVLYVFLAGYGLLRFLTDFFRMESARYLGLNLLQYLSLAMFGVGLYLLIKQKKKLD